mmetsp:Transcript_18301/g.30064  ORF Transcript_18301/g.30064 Transcript_18301/m.30064 type:complete len:378 (+) Transcript_18301:15-1148(+)
MNIHVIMFRSILRVVCGSGQRRGPRNIRNARSVHLARPSLLRSLAESVYNRSNSSVLHQIAFLSRYSTDNAIKLPVTDILFPPNDSWRNRCPKIQDEVRLPESFIADVQNFNKKFGFGFSSIDLLLHALVHPSYLQENVPSMDLGESHNQLGQMLELIGDSILSFAVGSYLFQTNHTLTRGELSQARAMIVCNNALYRFGRDVLQIDRLLLFSRKILARVNVLESKIFPDTVSNTVEMLIGALYLDRGQEAALRFIMEFMLPNMLSSSSTNLEPTARVSLTMLCQKKLGSTPQYVRRFLTREEDGMSWCKIEIRLQNDPKPIGYGEGRSIIEAKENAAKDALDRLHKSALYGNIKEIVDLTVKASDQAPSEPLEFSG